MNLTNIDSIEDKPMVSVLMTAYNREKYIAEAIESVLASTYTNFELIISDDASTDETIAIARQYESKDTRVKVYVNTMNLGQFANRNKAATYATGKYLKYVDSDDIIYPFMLQVMVDGMKRFPKAALGFCLTFGPCKMPLPYEIDSQAAFKQHFFEGGLLFVGPSGIIVERKAFESVNGFEEFGMPSDNHFSLKIAAKHPVVAMTKDLFWWRIHDEQVYTQNKKNYDNILNNYESSNDIILKHSPLNIESNKRLLKNQQKIFYLNLYRLVFKELKPLTALRLFLKMNKIAPRK